MSSVRGEQLRVPPGPGLSRTFEGIRCGKTQRDSHMAFVIPAYSKGQVNAAGDFLARSKLAGPITIDWLDQVDHATAVLNNWRAAHLYPINTFQATLRKRLKDLDNSALVGQRLKRTPSILAKLRRAGGMQLARMQDIGGLRAVVTNIEKVRLLESQYRAGGLQHELATSRDYIASPKSDGYRSVHLVFKYRNNKRADYDGLRIELQLRTRRQHEWATAVETTSTFLRQALKAGQGDEGWREFFLACSAAIAHMEGQPRPPGFEESTERDVVELVRLSEARLNALALLRGFSIAAEGIHRAKGSGRYHLVELNSESRTVNITPFATVRLSEAEAAYAVAEKRASEGAPIDVVLVSAGSIENMQRAYPNYFFDTEGFVSNIGRLINWEPATLQWSERGPNRDLK